MLGTFNLALVPSSAMPEDTLQVEEEEGIEGNDKDPEEEKEEWGNFLRSMVFPKRPSSKGRTPVSSEIVFYLSIVAPNCSL